VKRSAIFLLVVLVALGLLGASAAADQRLAGGLDPSFGSGGLVTSKAAGIAGIAVQPDGKIVVAGTTGDLSFLLARYLPDGSLDPSFGDGGYVETQVGGWGFASSIALQPDGKIVVAGGSYQGESSNPEVLEEFSLVRYNPNGSLDTSFGTDGIASTVIPEQQSPDACWPAEQSAAGALAVLPSGDILAAGGSEWNDGCSVKSADNSASVLARYKPDGSLDPTFADGGIAQTPGSGIGSGLAVRPDGEIVANGGDAPTDYAPGGSVNVPFNEDPKIHLDGSLTLRDGKVVVAGESPAKRHSHPFLVVARYGSGGRLDSTFGTHGSLEIRRVAGLPSAILAQKDGKLLIAAGPGPADVVRLLPDGRLDAHFGRGGIVSLGEGIGALGLQADGKVLVGEGNGQASMLARLLGGNNCVVPGLRGKTVSKARARLASSYCRLGRTSSRFSSAVPRGRVISTAPRTGARLPGGTAVRLVVSRGPRGGASR
jgi:uncharacterized delta-60 repeat protein